MSFIDKFFDTVFKNFKESRRIPKKSSIIYQFSKNGKMSFFRDKGNKSKKYYRDYMKDNLNTKIGLCSNEYFDKFLKSIKREYKRRITKIKKYISSQKKEVYIHISSVEIKELKETEKEKGFFLDSVFTFNPPGLWYSCGTAWADWYFGKNAEIFDSIILNIKEGAYYDFEWYPLNVYSVDLSDLKIGEIEDCEDLFKFSKKYKSTNKKEKRYLSIEKIKKDYDGIQICPYLAIKCNDYLKKMIPEGKEGTNSMDLNLDQSEWFEIISLALNGNISKRDQSIFWTYKWEAATGVVIKNIPKIKLTKII